MLKRTLFFSDDGVTGEADALDESGELSYTDAGTLPFGNRSADFNASSYPRGRWTEGISP